MNHKGTQTIETDRLILRRFTVDDADDGFKNWCGDDKVTEYLTWPTHDNVEVTKKIFAQWENSYSKNDYYQWAIVLKDLGEPIGSIAVVDSNYDVGMVHIGYCIGSMYWRKGIMSESLGALIKYFFEEIGVNRVESRHDPNNPNSGKVMVKNGMKYEGTLRQSDKNNKGTVDAAYYGLLASEYFADKR